MEGNPGALIHSYWSPLSPALIAAGTKVIPEPAHREILTVHIVNSLIGLAALASFTFLLCAWPQGYPFDVYYVHRARWKVVATVGFRGGNPYDAGELWQLDRKNYDALTDKIWAMGARAIVSCEDCGQAVERGWAALGDTGYCVLLPAKQFQR